MAALANASARILAEGGPGADIVREVVAAHFPGRAAAASHVEALARLGKLRRRRRKTT
ncbi:hypothetical protein [Chenggangzhangella methanolivorans]|uniref:Uncharacterized protein n=2 Tax=Chenggangzhangella methanolivorans TaxID=1437009 RepID=A0A9E6R7J3_9HYPH|nr:hypothetical protein [Chenggangzhangella methanolivorans]QZN99647.1 hypothetical protein K6K41_23605 [Chenggangzhangella methanolivorans]